MGKRTISRLLKRHLLIPALIAAVIVIASMAMNVHAAKDNGTFYLKDLYGDRMALEDAVIRGELLDGYHRTVFRIADGGVHTETQIFDQPEPSFLHRSIIGKLINGLDYTVYVTGSQYEIQYRDRSGSRFGHAKVGTGLVNRKSGNVNTFTNPLEYGLANVGDKIFFTVPTTWDYTGTNGIYALDFYPRPDQAEPSARRLASIDLNNNDPNKASGIEVLGLEAVGDKLALLLVEDNRRLIVRGYDSGDGSFIGEAAVDHFALAGRPEARQPGAVQTGRHNEGFASFADPEAMTLNLSFRRSDDTALRDHPSLTILSFDLSDGVRLIGEVKENFTDGEEDHYYGVMSVNHLGGKLYVAMTVRETEEQSGVPFEIGRPIRFMIYVYEERTLVYKGELMTDQNDDLIRVLNQSAASFGEISTTSRSSESVREGRGSAR